MTIASTLTSVAAAEYDQPTHAVLARAIDIALRVADAVARNASHRAVGNFSPQVNSLAPASFFTIPPHRLIGFASIGVGLSRSGGTGTGSGGSSTGCGLSGSGCVGGLPGGFSFPGCCALAGQHIPLLNLPRPRQCASQIIN